MTDFEQREAARQFTIQWRNKDKKEDADYQDFWRDLLSQVLGIEDTTNYIEFQKKVRIDGNIKSIDGYIPSTRVLIEHKSASRNLDKPEYNSGGVYLTPFDQADRYNNGLNYNERARWIITTNFTEIRIYNMDDRNAPPQIVYLKNLQDDYKYLDFLIDKEVKDVTKEQDLSVQAGKIVGEIYAALKKQYKDPESDSSLKSLNALCVRLVFCMFADDAGVFGRHDQFYNYMKDVPAKLWRGELQRVFKMLNTDYPDRNGYEPELEEFPYVNGGLFSDENSEIPAFTEEIIKLILEKGCLGFNWREISPTIFGAVFESTLNPDTRRKGGMHYTSVRNIHKVIDPLFLDDLKKEFEECKAKNSKKKRQESLSKFQEKLASLTFFDPACGSGNFLTETYLSLRRLENEVLRNLYQYDEDQLMIDAYTDANIGVKVSISQFYGIEINDFAVSVAKTALWIAEAQMLVETRNATNIREDFLPLTTNAHIIEENALLIDWESVIPREKLNYILGNPPFIGASKMSAEQKNQAVAIFGKIKLANSIDYVGAWYYKAADMIQGTSIKCAFVSTNSVTQGEQVAPLWKKLFESYNIHFDFAYRTFPWDSEAHIHCVIIGFSIVQNHQLKPIFEDKDEDKNVVETDNINAYLIPGPNVFISSRSTPLCNVPKMTKGNQPSDGGNLILLPQEKDEILKKEPNLERFIKPYIGSSEYLKNKIRYCFWLVDALPEDINRSKILKDRLNAVCKFREESSAKPTREKAETPHLFFSVVQPETNYLMIPRVSSQNRRYIPIGFMPPNIIASDSCSIIANATLYHFGVLTSNIHNAWMRIVAGRLKSDYRYSGNVVYNNFPWPSPTLEQKVLIERTAQQILNARKQYPNSTLADLYSKNGLKVASLLQEAHRQNNIAVMQAYGFKVNETSELECVAKLMRMYQELTEKK